MREFVLGLALVFTPVAGVAAEAVVLLHGMVRTEGSMRKMAAALEREGFVVLNVGYPSRTATIEELAALTIGPALQHPQLAGMDRIHFVAHSLGAILLRQYFRAGPHDRLGRVVMLGPPNQGSEVVDRVGDTALFAWINGPAGRQLGTGPQSLPNRLGPVTFEAGVIAGDRSINWINSLMIAGPDDGKVSVERTKMAGMKAHIVLHVSHPFMMRDDQAIRQTIEFLRTGRFLPLN